MRTVIIGGGGHCRAVIDILRMNPEIALVAILDKDYRLHGKELHHVPVVGYLDLLENLIDSDHIEAAALAIGDNLARAEVYQKVQDLKLKVLNCIHPRSIISTHANTLGRGIYIGANVVIGPNVSIGDNTIINSNVTIPHNNVIKKHVNISPGVHLGGGTIIDEGSFIGLGVSILQYVKIGKNCIIGAGAVVTEDIPDNSLAIGVPARVVKTLTPETYSQALYADAFRFEKEKQQTKQ